MLGTDRDAADGSLLTAYSLRPSDSGSAVGLWPSPASVLSPHSSILSLDILGPVYEQFLGKVIRLTGGHQANVEEKPECPVHAGPIFPAMESEPPTLTQGA